MLPLIKYTGIVAVLLFGIVLLVRPAPGVEQDRHSVLSVREIRIVDDQGNARITLSVLDDSPVIELIGGNPSEHIRLVGPDKSHSGMMAMHMVSQKEKSVLSLGLSHFATPFVKMQYGDGEPRVLIGVNQNSSPLMNMSTHDGYCLMHLPEEQRSDELKHVHEAR